MVTVVVLLAVLAAGGVIAPIAIVIYSAREGRLLRGLLAAAAAMAGTVAVTGVAAVVIGFYAALDFYKTQIPDPQPRPAEMRGS